MKKAAWKIVAAILSFLGLLVLIWLVANLFTANSQWARTIAWLDSDIDDYQRFPLEMVFNASPVFNFQQPYAELKTYYAPAFESITYAKNGATVSGNLNKFLEQNDTVAFLVIKDDVLLYERYFNNYDHNSTVTSFSTAKSFVSALIGIAISEGYIGSVEDPITKYVPELLNKDSRYNNITLRNLLTMSSGIRYDEYGMPWSDDAATYYSPDLRSAAVSSPITGLPGKEFHYNNYHPLLLGLVLERTTHRPVARYLEERIWGPLGMEAPGSWSLDSESNRFAKMESGINGRAIDFAKFGRLFLNNGNWNGRQIIPQTWVYESTRLDTSTDPAPQYQYFWWVNASLKDQHHYFAAGKHGQYIYIVPEQKLLFLRFGRSDPYRQWTNVFETLTVSLDKLDK